LLFFARALKNLKKFGVNIVVGYKSVLGLWAVAG